MDPHKKEVKEIKKCTEKVSKLKLMVPYMKEIGKMETSREKAFTKCLIKVKMEIGKMG